MKKCITPINTVYFLLISIIVNSYLLVKLSPYTLIAMIPLFVLINIVAGLGLDTQRRRVKTCNHGAVILAVFCASLIPSIIYHTILAFIMIPNSYLDLIYSSIFCAVASSIVFWNGIISVYCTSAHLGIRWRVLGALCGFAPILNLIVLAKMVEVTKDEVEVELEKEKIAADPALAELCKTKYPILLVHGVFFRDSKWFSYWGRIPRTLKAHGAKVYFGNHQSAIAIKDSAMELAARIKLVAERSGVGKVNIIAHSKGGLDCRYAISELGVAPYVASLTTINTPHRGCIFTERLLNAVPEKVKDGVATAYNVTLTDLGDESPDFISAVKDLTAEVCTELDAKMILPEGIYAQSVGSVMPNPKSGQFPLNLSYRYVKSFDGENDGLVGETSFKFGERYILLHPKGNRGISHADIIDLGRRDVPGFDVRGFYTELVRDLRDRGL